jgi:phosphoglycerol transferase MdoB-like AlkP superfamily enzyme
MEKNKYCCRIFPLILIIISLINALLIWYFDEGKHSFSFLTDKNEIFNFIGTILFIAIIPIGIFYWLNDKEKYQTRAKAISLLGFLPAVAVLGFIIF